MWAPSYITDLTNIWPTYISKFVRRDTRFHTCTKCHESCRMTCLFSETGPKQFSSRSWFQFPAKQTSASVANEKCKTEFHLNYITINFLTSSEVNYSLNIIMETYFLLKMYIKHFPGALFQCKVKRFSTKYHSHNVECNDKWRDIDLWISWGSLPLNYIFA